MSLTPSRKTSLLKVLIALGIFVAGLLIGYFVNSFLEKPVTITPIRDPDTGYSFVNPILYTEVSESLSFPKYSSLQNALSAYVAATEKNKQATYASIYFQDMNSGNWVGVNPTEKYDPASMLKVATLIALSRASEASPPIASAKINIPTSVPVPDSSTQAYFPPIDPVQSGNTYTVQDLMDKLIIQSDDGADEVLINFLGDDAIATVFTDLRIPLPGSSTGVSPQQYSHLFRVLYNSTYLTSADSERALQLLSETTFTQGLVAGVPTGTVVAHKFGESLFPPISENITWPQASNTTSDVPGLNDCGIVYYPNHPYFLCVMTQGTDFPTLASVIKGASSVTWAQMKILYPN